MDLAQRYSTHCGLKIGKPYLYQSFYPLPNTEIITLQITSGQEAKNYDYWQEVVNLIFPYLKNTTIILLGDDKTPSLDNCINLGGKTDFHQTAYIISKSKLHLGNDSWLAHYSASVNTPLISLYGSTKPSCHAPSFGDGFKLFIESHRNGDKPSFTANENPKSINLIKPEFVANSILKFLSIDSGIEIETLHIGANFNKRVLEVVPNTIPAADLFPDIVPNIRMDCLFDEKYLIQNLSIRPYIITTDKPIDLKILTYFKPKIVKVLYEIKEDYSVEFVRNLIKLGIQFNLFSGLGEKELKSAKLDLFDFGIIYDKNNIPKESLEFKGKVSTSTMYRTNKFLLADNKIFHNKFDWMRGISRADFSENTGVVSLENQEFFNDLDFLYLYNKI
jgi:Glycosyltransferase family 9 (heptosyltransferase)